MPVRFEEDVNMEPETNSAELSMPVQSIVETMKDFINAVEDMDETVLIPSRLRDMPAPQTTEPEESTNNGKVTKKAIVSNNNDISLYSHYTILKALRTELVRGHTVSKDMDESDLLHISDEDSESEVASTKLQIATARMFRHHLNGVVNTLQQLTQMSNKVTSQYRFELGDNQSCLKPKTFSV